MSWIKENKFLFGFIVVTGLGAGALGYLVLGAKGKYDEAQSTYTERANELNRLQRLAIYPNQKNLDKLVAQKEQVSAEVKKLSDGLIAQQLPIEDITPEKFQDKLNATARAVRAKAAAHSPPIQLGKDANSSAKFYLGFERYETAPPEKNAAPVVARQLKAMDWLINTMIDKNVGALTELVRDELPEEKGAKAEAKPEDKKGGGKPSPKEAASKLAIHRHNITLKLLCDQQHFRDFLNAIVANKQQYFVPRLITVKNEKATGPARSSVVAEVTAPPVDPNAPPAAGTPQTPTTAPVSQFIVGEERVEVTLLLEMLDFVEPAPAK